MQRAQKLPRVLTRNTAPSSALSRTLTLDRTTINEEGRTVELSFSSEAPYERYFGSEILSHDTDAIDLQRLQEVGVLLFAHGRDARYGKLPIGSIEKVWLDQGQRKARALVKFDDDEESDKIFQKVKKGMIKGVSVGYAVSSWEEVKGGKTSANGRFTGPAYVALKWQPFEISIEPTPADPSVGVGRSFEPPIQVNESEENEMLKGLKHVALAAQGLMHAPDTGGAASVGVTSSTAERSETVNTADLQRQAMETERARVTDITDLCRNFDVAPDEYIRTGATVQAVKDAILQKQIESRKPQATGIQVVAEEVDKFRSAASDALLIRAGRRIEKPAAGALELRSLRLRDLAVECVLRAGDDGAHLLRDEELLRRALSPDTTFQSIVSNAVNKSVSNAYQETPTTFQHWTSKGSNADFKAAEHYRISEAGNLELVAQNGTIVYDDAMKDEKVTKSVLTYAKRWGFTREAFINDDLSVLNRVPAAYVMAAKRGINKLVYKTLASNPSIFDAKELFHEDHRNLGTAGAIGKVAMSEARKLMRTQKGIRNEATLNISPRYLIVPAELETDAAQFMRSEADLESSNSGVVNVFRNSYTVIVDAELDQYSADAWYLAADPMLADTIEVTYLRGQEEPTVETEIPFDKLGLDFRIYFDYGVTVLDYRGLFKNAGTAVTP